MTKRLRCVEVEGPGGARSLGADRADRHQYRHDQTDGSLKQDIRP